MPVFHVTLTKEMDVTILADTEADLEAALEEENIDSYWDPPEWTWEIYNPLKAVKQAAKVPKEVGKFDMAVVDGRILSADERGDLKSRIEAVKERAGAELQELRLKLASQQLT